MFRKLLRNTMHRFPVAISILVLLAIAYPSHAADAYFMIFNAAGRQSVATGHTVWLSQVVLFNTNSVPVEVKMIDINGVFHVSPPTLTLPPQRLTIGLPSGWAGVPTNTLFVLHLDIPAGVIVDSQVQFYFDRQIPELFPFSLGKATMPVFRELVPAGKPQVHIGTDLHGSEPSRVNVGIYNAGSETASATIEVHIGCDDAIADTRTVSIPPNMLVQTNGLNTGTATCGVEGYSNLARYTVVTVSQPSLSYVSNINENTHRAPDVLDAAPFVGLSIANNIRY